ALALAHFETGVQIVGSAEMFVGSGADYPVLLWGPCRRTNAKLRTPRVAYVGRFGEKRSACLLHETRVVPRDILRELRHRHGPARLSLELIAVDDFGSGEEGAGRPVARGVRRSLHSLRHADGVDLVARLQRLLLQ